MVEVRTRLGVMVVALYNETPVHRDHFLARVGSGAMDGLLFHRVVPGFAIEGGDAGTRQAVPGIALGLEADSLGLPLEIVPGLIHKHGALAAAPAGDGPELGRRSHRERFFIVDGVPFSPEELARTEERNTALGAPFAYSEVDRRVYATEGGQPRCDGSYTVFGEVVSGFDVLEAIIRTPCNEWDRPMENIEMHLRQLQ